MPESIIDTDTRRREGVEQLAEGGRGEIVGRVSKKPAWFSVGSEKAEKLAIGCIYIRRSFFSKRESGLL